MTPTDQGWKHNTKPEIRRGELLRDLQHNQIWIGTLKKVQTTFPEDQGLSASCMAFILLHLSEIERITEELRKYEND